MVLLYIKLGTATEFYDERLGVVLTLLKPRTIVDANNVTYNITSALNSGAIVQLDAAQYYAETDDPTNPPLVVNPPELININEYMPPCPDNAFVMFGWIGSKWYKILWSTLKQCLGSAPSSIQFRVGAPDIENPEYPEDGDDSFINPLLENKSPQQLIVTRNGTIIYHKSLWHEDDQADNVWYTLHGEDPGSISGNTGSTPGKFKLNIPFLNKDIITING